MMSEITEETVASLQRLRDRAVCAETDEEMLGVLVEVMEAMPSFCDGLQSVIEAQVTEIASLRTQLAQRIDPREMLRWEGEYLWLSVPSLHLKTKIAWILHSKGSGCFTAPSLGKSHYKVFSTEPEARAAVERAVLEALGVRVPEEER